MKKVKHAKKYEPTLTDVLEAVQVGFGKHDERFDSMDRRFDTIEQRLDNHDRLLKSLHGGQENLKEQVQDINHRLIKTQNRVEDIADILEVDHERRITRLEKARA